MANSLRLDVKLFSSLGRSRSSPSSSYFFYLYFYLWLFFFSNVKDVPMCFFIKRDAVPPLVGRFHYHPACINSIPASSVPLLIICCCFWSLIPRRAPIACIAKKVENSFTSNLIKPALIGLTGSRGATCLLRGGGFITTLFFETVFRRKSQERYKWVSIMKAVIFNFQTALISK